MANSAVLGESSIIYLSPKPDAEWVSIQSTIILRFDEELTGRIDPSQVLIQVIGDKSGYHQGQLMRSKQQKTYIFKPNHSFEINDTVKVMISFEIEGKKNDFSYQFYTRSVAYLDQKILRDLEHFDPPPKNNQVNQNTTTDVINGVSVPSDFPPVSVGILGETAPGKLFIAPAGGVPYILILENDGTPYFYQRISDFSRDFKVQPTGTLTRRERGDIMGYVEMDTNFQIIDTLQCGNGYGTDQHGAQILANGNFLLIGVDLRDVDMSELVAGGNPEARVIGNHVLEHDPEGNVIFEWRSWDHFNILDAEHVNFGNTLIDYVHLNSIAVDYDSNIVISSRHLSEVTKINRQTGEIMWRLGGKNNQFEFVNDIDSISYQHDARPVPGMDNHYTIFDNGNHKTPQYSRAVEFLIDTTTMTATKIWEYRHSPDRYGYAMGNVQRLANGNTLINWSGNPDPIASEVDDQGEIIYEMDFTNGVGNYRTFRFDWTGRSPIPYLILEKFEDRITLLFNKFGDPHVEDYIIYAGLEPNPETPIDTTIYTWIDLTDFKYNERYYFRVTARDSSGNESDFSNEVNTLINFVAPGENIVRNGDFSDEDLFWDLDVSSNAGATGLLKDEVYHVAIDSGGSSELDIQLKQGELSIQEGKHYILDFDAYAESPRTIEVNVEKASTPFNNYSSIGFVFIQTDFNTYSYPFEMTYPSDPEAQLVFNCGYEEFDIYIDNISLREDLSATIKDQDLINPSSYHLSNNYPNPFNPTTIINYELPITNYVELNIYNINGQKVDNLVSAKQQPGKYQVEWDAGGYASGVYFYRLSTNTGFDQTKKLVLLR
jgi:hypothetical protein